MNLKGRPSGYNPEVHLVLASYFAQEGMTEEQIATRIGISKATLTTWKQKYPEFLASLKTTKDEADAKVVESLYKQALKGNVTAQIFWLKNRQPEKWRDAWKIEGGIEHSGKVTVEGKLSLSIEQVIQEYADAIGAVPEANRS